MVYGASGLAAPTSAITDLQSKICNLFSLLPLLTAE
jgi:hypothetical protein